MSSATRRRYKSREGNKKAYYPWDEWFALEQFTIRKGVDFICTLPGMTVNIRAAARVRGIRVRIDQRPDGMTITVKDE